jgi:Tat protein translocase TatB subunit
MFGIGMTELLVIFVIGLLVLGPKRLPELARSLGRGLAEFRRASLDMRREFSDVAEEAHISPQELAGQAEPKPSDEAKPTDAAEAPDEAKQPAAAAAATPETRTSDRDG